MQDINEKNKKAKKLSNKYYNDIYKDCKSDYKDCNNYTWHIVLNFSSIMIVFIRDKYMNL